MLNLHGIALLLEVAVSALSLGLSLWGTYLGWRHFVRSGARPLPLVRNLRPISILKPVKGLELGLAENLESFFSLNYPQYELIFSVADLTDPAVPLIESLLDRHPSVAASLVIGVQIVGANPKVNNLVKSYQLAKYDMILISDSNIRVGPGYLSCAESALTENVGIVTAAISGTTPSGTGAWLESVFLNTFYTRWMLLAPRFGQPVVIGKSMLLRRSDSDRFGGLANLGRYLAEDYMAGKAMRYLGREVALMRQPVNQPLLGLTLRSFWSRHIRWGRIRKSQAPLIFLIEPLFSSVVSGLFAASVIHSQTKIAFLSALSCYLLIWMISDLLLIKCLTGRFDPLTIGPWILRELIHFPLWVHIAIGNRASWRGRTLRLKQDGLLEV